MRLHWLLPTIKGIPVLMYHRIWPGQQDGLTLTPEQLRGQWLYLKKEGYEAISMQEFLGIACGTKPVPNKAVLLTFDDGYYNNLTHVYPLLQELAWSATIFIIADTLDGTATETPAPIDKKLGVADLRGMDRKYIQLAFHGYHHENFSKISVAEIDNAMQRSQQAFRDAGLVFEPVLAYPYGARPKDNAVLKAMKDTFRETGLQGGIPHRQ